MKDFKEFLSNNENRNLWFSAMACGMTLAIVIFALSCCFFMVYADTPIGYPAFEDSSNGETIYMSTLDFKLVANSSGLYDAISTDSQLAFNGTLSSSGSWNSGGARTSQSRSFEFNGETKTYYIIQDLVWSDRVINNSSIYEFNSDNRENALSSLFDDSYNQYASNYNSIYQMTNDFNGFFEVQFTNVNSSGATLNVVPTSDFWDSGLSGSDFHVNVSVCSYSIATSTNEQNPFVYSNELLNNAVADSGSLLRDSKRIGSGHAARDIVVLADDYPDPIRLCGPNENLTPGGIVQSIKNSIDNVAYGTIVCGHERGMDYFQNGAGSYNVSFDQNCLISNFNCVYATPSGIGNDNYNLSGITRPFAYSAIVTIEFPNNFQGNVRSTPIYTYAIIDKYSFKGSGSTVSTSSTSYSSVDPSGQISKTDTTDNINPFSSIDNISNDNIVDFVNNGMGLGGANGLIMLIQQTFSFLPAQLWQLIFAALALSILLMVVKILRGM